MAPFPNPLRHLWPRNPAPVPPNSTTVTNLDGVSDSELCSQQMDDTSPQQHLNDPPLVRPMAGEHEATSGEGGHRTSLLPQYGQPFHELPIHQGAVRRDGPHSFEQIAQELRNGGQGQYESTSLQQYSRSATHQPPEMYPQVPVNNHDIFVESKVRDSDDHIWVKQELTTKGADDRDIFAEFTNQDSDDEVVHTRAEQDQASNNVHDVTDQAPRNGPVIKQESGNEGRLHSDPTEQAGSVDWTTATHNMAEAPGSNRDHTLTTSVIETAGAPSEANADISRVSLMEAHPQVAPSQLSNIAESDTLKQQFSFEQHVSNTEQPTVSLQDALTNDAPLRSPSADSVLGSQRHSSEETAGTLSGMDLAANQRMLAQQWAQRHQLSGMSTMSAEAVHANPRLLHGPASMQYHNLPPTIAEQPFAMQALKGQQRVPDPRYSTNMQYLSQFMDGRNAPNHPQQMQAPFHPGVTQAPGAMMQQALRGYPPAYAQHGPSYPHRIVQVQEAERSGESDDDEPLATRAPRHRSTTASRDSRSPFEAAVASNALQQHVAPNQNGASAPKSTPSGNKADSVIELSDDDEDASMEPISWKLPDHEVTYRPAATVQDLPSAIVSIPNLVREAVLLTEDHAEQEMALFTHVFLPGQQALAAPDPEPAHAVLNFHTIAVMVVEAFVQFEIGDEMGRGYGFHGGNQALRPPSASASSFDEPPRVRAATDADVDDIFFAVVDRWRAGLASGSDILQRIRGCQEFCDVALDVIHYVKEHGLLRQGEREPEPRKRKERSDKGVTRGPKGGAKGSEAKLKTATATKRKADAIGGKALAKKVNQVDARKKPKLEAKKVKPKAKSGALAVTVMPRKK